MTKKSGPLLSVVIATLNARAHLQECLDSVYGQRNPSWEIIIIDGGSEDGTVEVIRNNAAKLKYWISESDAGVYAAWNKALPRLNGDWIIFLGADDRLWDDAVLQRAESVLTDHSLTSRIVYGRVAIISENGDFLGEEGRAWTHIWRRFQQEMCIPHQGVFHRREIFSTTRFDTSFRYAGDYDLLLRELKKAPPIFLDLCIATWRQGGLTSSAARSLKVLREFRTARAKMGIVSGHPYWSESKAMAKLGLGYLLGRKHAEGFLATYRKLRGR
jgi:glycosyltransferase involved in cell wall biosynthesis